MGRSPSEARRVPPLERRQDEPAEQSAESGGGPEGAALLADRAARGKVFPDASAGGAASACSKAGVGKSAGDAIGMACHRSLGAPDLDIEPHPEG